MSVVPSLSTVLSLLSFLTTVFALARVGAAAFSANQTQESAQRSWSYGKPAAHALQLQLGGPGMSLAQAVRFGLAADTEKGKAVGYIGGHDLVRMPASTWTGVRKPGLLFRPPSPFPDQAKPLSMAKLIMSRHVRGALPVIFLLLTSRPFSNNSKIGGDLVDPHPSVDRQGSRHSRRRALD